MKIGCYADGNYMCKCNGCGKEFTGNKRAISCLDCAVKALQAANAELNVKLAEAIIDYVTQVTREEAYDELIAQAADTLHQVCAQIEKKSDLLAGYIEVTTAGDAAAGLRVFMLKGEREGGEE